MPTTNGGAGSASPPGCRDSVSRKLKVPPGVLRAAVAAIASVSPLGLASIDPTGPTPAFTPSATTAPLATSRNVSVPSSCPMTSVSPSGLKETALPSRASGRSPAIAVPQSHLAAVDRRQRLSVGAERNIGQLGSMAAENGRNAPALLGRRHERAACLRYGPRLVRLEREQKREIEPAVQIRYRLTRGLPSLSELTLLVCALRLPYGEQRRYDRRREQDRKHGRQHAESPRALPRHLELVLLGISALLEELALELVQLDRVLCVPLERRREAGAPVELRGVTASLVPCAGGPHQVLAQAAAGQSSSSQVCRRGHSRSRASWETSTVPSLTVSRRLSVSAARTARASSFASRSNSESGARRRTDPSASPDASRRRMLRATACCDSVSRPYALSASRPDCAPDTAAGFVVLQPKRAAVPLLPELEQRGRQEWQRPRLVPDVGDERVDELGLDPKPGLARRQPDRAAQLLWLHGPDEDVIRAEQVGEFRVGGTAAVEGGSDGDDDREPPLDCGRQL